jgi:hypothetical protein
MAAPSRQPGPITCEGPAFDDFRLTDHLPPEAAPAVIERDRLFMAARPGFDRKLLPLRVDQAAFFPDRALKASMLECSEAGEIVTGACGDLPSLWPNSPPLPAPKP